MRNNLIDLNILLMFPGNIGWKILSLKPSVKQFTSVIRECRTSRHNGGAQLMAPFRVLSSLRGLRGAPEVPPLERWA